MGKSRRQRHRENNTSRTLPNPREQTPPQDRSAFQRLVRDLTGLLKMVHHRLAFSTQGGATSLPKAFKQKVKELDNFLKPARPTPDLTRNLSRLAEGWGFQVRDTLLLHYDTEFSELQSSIRGYNTLSSDEYEKAVQVSLA